MVSCLIFPEHLILIYEVVNETLYLTFYNTARVSQRSSVVLMPSVSKGLRKLITYWIANYFTFTAWLLDEKKCRKSLRPLKIITLDLMDALS